MRPTGYEPVLGVHTPLSDATAIAGPAAAMGAMRGRPTCGPGPITVNVDPSEITVIGKMKDLGNLGPGETTLLDRLPDQGSPKLNWQQNSGVLRSEMNKGLPIRDASVDGAGNLRDNTGFIRAERNLLQDHGWTYDPVTRTWNLP